MRTWRGRERRRLKGVREAGRWKRKEKNKPKDVKRWVGRLRGVTEAGTQEEGKTRLGNS